jgi:beta-mannosidase
MPPIDGNSAIVDADAARALATARGLIDIPWQEDFAATPFSIEAWVKPGLAREWVVTCAYPAGKAIAAWAMTVGAQQELAAVIIGEKARWIWNQTRIVDGKWHHLAVVFDGENCRLLVDGKTSPQAETVTEAPALNFPAGLRIGADSAVCEALVREVRFSRGVRDLTAVATPFASDEQTIFCWTAADATKQSRVTVFGRQSLDELEKLDYQAGPAPMDWPPTRNELSSGQAIHAHRAPIVSLDGQWEMAEGGDERERLATGLWSDAIPAAVPGGVHLALEQAGKIPDPKFARNDEIARQQSFKTWWMRTSFPRPAGGGHRLVFDGVAIHCVVWLNGQRLGEHEGMFGGPEFDVAALLRDRNELVVRLDPAPTGPPAFAPTHNTGWRKTVVFNNVYGWHYCNIPALGIWRSVRVEAMPVVKILNPFVITRDAPNGEISLIVELSGPAPSWRGTLRGTIAPENFQGPTQEFSVELDSPAPLFKRHLQMRIRDPKLWWPNGLGPQNLYRLTLSIEPLDGDGDCVSTTFGLRTLEMAPFPDGPRPCLYNWTMVINGRPTFLKGSGWCTMDSSMDFRRERYERFLQLAKDENCQMLRAWGSGMPETDDFYDLCDRLGITVFQEWPTAWNSHLDQPLDLLEDTVRRNTLRLRNHPSLLIWGGGNESSNPAGAAINMMGRLAIELDGTRAFHRGEPWGGSDHNYACWWGDAPLDHNLKMESRFFGEFGIASMPVVESVRRYLPADEQNAWPPADDSVLAHHTPVFNTMGDMKKLRQYAGGFTAGESLERFVVASQLAQAVAVRHTLERARTRWPMCVGALMYKLNDNYPGASWSTVDWYGAPKLSHWFVRDAFAPLHACLLFQSVDVFGQDIDLPVFLLDDADELGRAEWSINVRAYGSGLQLIRSESFDGAGAIDRVRQVGQFPLTARESSSSPLFLVIEVVIGEQLRDRTFYYLNCERTRDGLFDLPRTSVTFSVDDGGRGVVLKNVGALPAVGASIVLSGREDSFRASGNCFWLEAGTSSQIITVSETDGLKAVAWNA